MRRKSISRASLSSEGPANKDSENPSQDANRLGDKTDNQLIGGSPEFASDSTSMSNFQLPKIAMVDEGSIGSSRFDVAVRALKGDFDPPTPSENTEKGTLLEALVQFPSFYTFSVVGKVETTSRKPGHDFTKDTLETVERMCRTRLAEDSYSVKERAGGMFLSLRITTLVESADLVKATYTELRKDPRVIMAY